MKTCTKCKENKELVDFPKRKNRKDGRDSWCYDCYNRNTKNHVDKDPEAHREKRRQQYKVNPEPHKESNRKSAEKNKEKRRVYKKMWAEKNRIRLLALQRARTKERKKKDPKFKLMVTLRTRIYQALQAKSWKKGTKFSEYIGCTLEELKKHIEYQFLLGMTWENHGEWHIDHIVPLDSAQAEEELYRLCHYTNLQPLWAKDNRTKSNNIAA